MLIWLSVFGLLNATAHAFVPLISGRSSMRSLKFPRILRPCWYRFSAPCHLGHFAGRSNVISWWSGFQNDKLSTCFRPNTPRKDLASSSRCRSHSTPCKSRAIRATGSSARRARSPDHQQCPPLAPAQLPEHRRRAHHHILYELGADARAPRRDHHLCLHFMERGTPAFRTPETRCIARGTAPMAMRHDALGNIREIKQAATEKQERKKIRNNFINRAAQFWVDINTIFARLTFLQKMLVSLTQLSIFIISIFFVRNGTLTPGGLWRSMDMPRWCSPVRLARPAVADDPERPRRDRPRGQIALHNPSKIIRRWAASPLLS